MLPASEEEIDALLGVGEVARALTVSTATVYKLCHRSELVYVRIGNALRVRREDLASFVASRSNGSRS